MAELVLELFSEEIPARMQARGAAGLARLVGEQLAAAGLSFDPPVAYVTPRRLALVVDGLPDRQPDVREEKRGPRIDAPEKAIQGFLRANGVTRDQCEQRKAGKGTFWFAVLERAGRPTTEVLPDRLAAAVAALTWPKSMRWGAGHDRWVRTLERGLCVFDGAPLAFDLPGGVPVGAVTTGHRFLDPGPIEVTSFAQYHEALRTAHVVLDPAERRQIIADGAAALAAAEGLSVKEDKGLLEEVAGLVEWPVPLMGRIDEAFMDVPAEVLTTAMRTHQKYFSVLAPDGTLAPRFVVVANTEAPDGGAGIVAGNERVLRARLSDAKFFWDQDRKSSLASRVDALQPMVFHAGLGSLVHKVARIEALAGEIAAFLPGADAELARSAARLAKADLTTEMVYEFPELQGTMGGHYARHDGWGEAVALAVAEHYAPQGPGDDCPRAPLSVALAMADKLDTLVGFFAVGERPTGSGDPYALRRAALGIIRLVIENGIRLSLREVIRKAYWGYNETVPDFEAQRDGGHRPKILEAALLGFFADRLKVHLRAQGVRHDLIAAVFELGGEDDLVRLLARVAALERFLSAEDGANLLIAHKRASNIVAIEEKKDGAALAGPSDAALLAEPEEAALHGALEEARRKAAPLVAAERFDDAMTVLADLRGPVDAFFDCVTVNSKDAGLRANRLRLLSEIRETMGAVADFSQIEG